MNANVLPMDREGDTLLAGQTVLIRDGIIQQVGPSSRVRIPAGAMRVEARGRYLMPGLADMHVHMVGPRELQEELLKMYVVAGVTTILNMRGAPEHLALRGDIRAGRVLGPNMYTVGRYVNAPFFVTPDSVEREVVAQKRAGYDFIKMHGELSREAYARLNAVGKREGIRIIGHAPRTLGIDVVFAERQYALAHAEEFLYDITGSSREADLPKFAPRIPELTRKMVAADVWLMPNLTAYRIIGLMAQDLSAILARPEMKYLPAVVRAGWGPIGEQGSRGRAQLLGTSFAQYERAFREQLGDMFAPGGFDPRKDIAGIILNRWGHAYVNPQPGFFFGLNGKPAPRDILRNQPHGRVAFANTDLAGASDHRNSIREADRAVKQLLGA